MRIVNRDRIAILGTGYVGTANAVGFAELGYEVVGYDIDARRIGALAAGIPPYRELGLAELLSRHVAGGKLTFVTDLASAVRDATFIIIAVGTPSSDDGSADLSALEAAVDALRSTLTDRSAIVVLRSTVPAGTSDRIAARLSRLDVLFCPEFLREGNAVWDFLHPDRTIIGAASRRAAEAYAELMRPLSASVIFTKRRDAELIKGGANAFLALKISFANEIANLCGALDANALEVLRGIGADRRIGEAYLTPGIGFGGPCFEKDVQSLEHVARHNGSPSQLLQATLRVNDAQPRRVVDILEEELGQLQGARVGVWGLAFKAGTDDLRSSLALRVLDDLATRGASVIAYDPAIESAELPGSTALARSAMEAANADALLVLTEWPEFSEVDPAALAVSLRRRIVVDGRNVLDGERFARCGIRYRGVGRSMVPEYEERVAVWSGRA
ncbi:MAG TPA: UDP-glucose/GDP-mannose dehydrogenase family protein [Candidatus Nitrosotalea sp.]|nr:UDP-glucose/GDP-mannose dehydrogenase family protein [Candidatus Nitrosotalea sp.]